MDPFRERIADWLKQGLSGVRMLELARDDAEHPYRGSSSVWRAAVRRERLSLLHEQAVADVPIRFEGLPGEYLQVDWGEIRHFPFTQQKPVTRRRVEKDGRCQCPFRCGSDSVGHNLSWRSCNSSMVIVPPLPYLSSAGRPLVRRRCP